MYAVNIPVTGVTLDKATATVVAGASLTLTPTIAPASATNRGVTWTSSAPGNVMVTNKGVITGLTPGTSTITVKTTDGAKTATCVVTVTAA
ncbi:TPA: Ig-like domain-containing protein [Serratia fonticola]